MPEPTLPPPSAASSSRSTQESVVGCPTAGKSTWTARVALATTLSALGLVAMCAGCPTGPGPNPTDGGGDSFDDHTVSRLATMADFTEIARTGPQSSTVKFVLTDFASGANRETRYLESASFYTLHDEWYWFRLLNGARAPGSDRTPAEGLSFDTIQEIYAWAELQTELPLDLRYIAERLYSPEFYSLALSTRPRAYGLGSLLNFPARTEPEPRVEIWAFELEYSDDVSHAELDVFFQMILSTVPPQVGPEMKWLVRSPAQEVLAKRMEEFELPWFDRIIRYSELTVAGENEVYSEGLTAGRLRMVRAGESGIEDSRSTDVLIVEEIPDFLPPASALLTSLPQTPLAHINVLARNRGIPNAYVGGIFDDPQLDSLGRVSAPVAVRAIAAKEGEPSSVDILPITETQFATWRSLNTRPVVSVPVVDTSTAPYTLNLEDLSLADIESLRPLIGGKSAGFLALLAPERELETPDRPVAITARLFREHLAVYQARVEELIADRDFARNSRLRFLVLEGEPAYRARYTTADDLTYLASILARPQGDIVADTVRLGGVVQICRDTPLPAAAEAIELSLEERYASYDITQGLRFRSSSTVEDIEGFNGAGLYTSNTGFLYAELLERQKDKDRTVSNAILKTFSSYWGSEAWEERTLSNVVHMSGSMALLVHARFDDAKEMSNGVFTFTVNPPEVVARTGDKFFLDINVQAGELSVTNPPPGVNAQPEVVHVFSPENGPHRIVRVAASSEVPAGEVIFTDAMAQRLFEDARVVTEAWLVQENVGVLNAQKGRTLTLDFELREMDRAWPLLASTNQFARRVVIKQARSLEPGLSKIPVAVRNHPVPRDLVARARRVERRACTSGAVEFSVVDIYSDPLTPPDLGYNDEPFAGYVTVATEAGVPEINWSAGYRRTFVHTSMTATHPGVADGGPWAFRAVVNEAIANATGIQTITADENGFVVETAAGTLENEAFDCTLELQYSTPDEYLSALYEADAAPPGVDAGPGE